MTTAVQDADVLERPRRRRGPGWLLAGIALLVVVGMWAYVFGYHLSGRWREDTPGRLADPSFAEQAEPICDATLTRLDALPLAHETPSADARADVVDESNRLLRAMLDDLGALSGLAGAQEHLVAEWLTDWATYVEDREEYAERVRTDPETRLYVTQSDRDRRQITLAIDRFATINRMPSCTSPSDIA